MGTNTQVKEVYFVGGAGLDAYYHTLAKEVRENMKNIQPVSLDFDGAYYRPDGSDALKWGQPVKPDFMPKRIQKNGPKRAVPDFEKGWGMALVNEKFKQVVESLEPDVHQFFPVEHVWKNGDAIENGPYFWFVVCNALDSVNAEHSEATQAYGFSFLAQREGRRLWKTQELGGGASYKVVFDLKSINGHHIWRDKYLTEGPYCSGQFKQACEDAGIVGIGFGKNKLTVT